MNDQTVELLQRIAKALELQSTRQQECNDLNKAQSEEWKALQIQWREENQQRENAQHAEKMAREDQWREENRAAEKKAEILATRLLLAQQKQEPA